VLAVVSFGVNDIWPYAESLPPLALEADATDCPDAMLVTDATDCNAPLKTDGAAL
jgi:hypothetical protein